MHTVADETDTTEMMPFTPPEEAMPWIVPLREQIEDELKRTIARAAMPDNLTEAVEYALFGGGKRVRPTLCLLSAQAAGGDPADALPAAAALELIHCFSLVHDDLPAMDDDDLRRGRPSLHIHAGHAMAVLGGDVMQTLAFEAIAQSSLSQVHISMLNSELAQATREMIMGQVWDTLGGFPKDMLDADRLNCIHKHKTGALIRCSCRMGAISAGADDQTLDVLSRYGEDIGLMFQIVDDLLDVTQSTEQLGKAAGKDQAAGKLTFPGVFGVEESRTMVEQLRADARSALDLLDSQSCPLTQLCDYLAVRTR